jgi:hypothetical protein
MWSPIQTYKIASYEEAPISKSHLMSRSANIPFKGPTGCSSMYFHTTGVGVFWWDARESIADNNCTAGLPYPLHHWPVCSSNVCHFHRHLTENGMPRQLPSCCLPRRVLSELSAIMLTHVSASFLLLFTAVNFPGLLINLTQTLTSCIQ